MELLKKLSLSVARIVAGVLVIGVMVLPLFLEEPPGKESAMGSPVDEGEAEGPAGGGAAAVVRQRTSLSDQEELLEIHVPADPRTGSPQRSFLIYRDLATDTILQLHEPGGRAAAAAGESGPSG